MQPAVCIEIIPSLLKSDNVSFCCGYDYFGLCYIENNDTACYCLFRVSFVDYFICIYRSHFFFFFFAKNWINHYFTSACTRGIVVTEYKNKNYFYKLYIINKLQLFTRCDLRNTIVAGVRFYWPNGHAHITLFPHYRQVRMVAV